jgi:predicted ATP-dependent serine protease
MANAETSFCGGCGSNTLTWMGCPVCKQIELQKKQIKVQEKAAKAAENAARAAAKNASQVPQQYNQTYYDQPQSENNSSSKSSWMVDLLGTAFVCWLLWQGVMWVYHLVESMWHSFISIF